MRHYDKFSLFKMTLVLFLCGILGGCASRGSAKATGKYRLVDNKKVLEWELSQLGAKAYDFVVEGALYEQRGMIPEAVYSYKRAVDEDDESPFLRTRFAIVLLRKGDVEQATFQVKKAISLNENYIEAYSILGRVHIVKNELDKAIEQFRKIIGIDKSAEAAYIDLCNVYLELKDFNEAVGILQKLIKVSPSNALAYYYLGRTYSEMNKLEEAKKYYKKVIDIKPLFVSAYKAVGLIEEFQANYREAIKYFKKALQIEIGNDNLRGHIAQIYIEIGDYEGALSELRVLSQNNLSDVSLKVKMGLVLLKLIRLDEAIDVFKEVIDKEPDSARVRYYLGGAYFQKNRFDDALKHFSNISSRSELFPDARLNIAYILSKKGDVGRAKEILRKAIVNMPRSTELYIALASFHENEKKYEEAEKVLKKADSNIPDSENIHLRLANLYDKMGKKEEGLKEINKVLKINPENPSALNYLAYTYAEDGEKLKEALVMVRNALKLKPGDAYITDTLGWIYYKMGDIERARAELEKAAGIVQNEPIILEHLGDVYAKLGVRNKAVKMYTKAVELYEEKEDIERVKEKIRKFAHDSKFR